jgi:hypothetical protein
MRYPVSDKLLLTDAPIRYLDPDPLLLAASAVENNTPLNQKFHSLNQAIAQLVRGLNNMALYMTLLLAL